jgi:hypothetical protein
MSTWSRSVTLLRERQCRSSPCRVDQEPDVPRRGSARSQLRTESDGDAVQLDPRGSRHHDVPTGPDQCRHAGYRLGRTRDERACGRHTGLTVARTVGFLVWCRFVF